MFLLYPTCLFLALRFSHLQPVITNVVNNLAVPKENTVTSENLDVDIAAKNCTEIPGGGRGYSEFQVTVMIEWGKRTSLVSLYSQNYSAGICGHYHQSSDCSEYPKKSLLKSSHP